MEEIKVEEIRLETDEASFGPIKSQHQYFKSINPSRLNRIYYKLRITPNENKKNEPILEDFDHKELEINENTFYKEGYIYLNKLVDKIFYINEGVRYYLIYQIVDNATYGSKNSVSLKSLLMPIKITRDKELIVPELNEDPIELNYYEVMLFAKKVNPMLYFIGKEAYNSLVKMNVKDEDNIISEWQNYKDPEIIDKVNKFLGTDLKFSDYLDKLLDDENRVIFNVKGSKKKDNNGIYISVDKDKLKNDELTKATVACMLNIYEMDSKSGKKKKVVYNYDDLISPWFWIDKLSTFFTRNNDSLKKFEKIKTMLVSLVRLVDDPTRKILPLKKEDKENTLTIMRYIIRDFDKLSVEDSQDLDNKRIRLFEYQLFPLRKYFSDQIYRVLNSPTRSRAVLERMFSNLSPMSVIKQTVTNELLRYYNSTNDMNLFSAFLKFTFRGPQSVNRITSIYQQDVHPSYTGRLSLIASSAGSPGLSGTIVPFVEISDDYYFNKENVNE